MNYELQTQDGEVIQVTGSPDRRRKPREKVRPRELKTIQERHHEIIRRLMLGQSNVRIADALGITKEDVSLVRNSPIVQKQLGTLHAVRDQQTINVSRQIRDLAPASIKLLGEIIEGKGVGESAALSLRAKVAQDNLDRSGHPRQTNIRSENVHAFVTRQDIEDIKQRAMQRATLAPTE